MGIQLRVQEHDGSQRVLNLKETVVRIGRNADNQVVIKDPRSSRTHCRVSGTPQGVILEDMKSANGTLLNGKPVTRAILRPGDEFSIGATRIVYDPGDEAKAVAEAPDGHAPAENPPADRAVETLTEAVDSRDETPAIYLTCVEGTLKGRRIDLSKTPFTLGRRRECDLPLEDGRVSARHAQIVRDGEALVVEDLGSKNGFLLDGKKVSRGTLVTGSRLSIGPVVLVATVAGTQPAATNDDRQGRSGREARPSQDAGDDVVLSRVDVEHLFAGDRARQPLVAVALIAVVLLLSYFAIDVARRLLIKNEPDPVAGNNLIRRNWSFEEILPEPAGQAAVDGAASVVPGWTLADGDRGKLEVTHQLAQYPGVSALKLTSLGDEDLCAAVQDSLITLAAEREFILEGYVANQGAFFAGYLVEWLQGEEQRVVAQTFSECTQGADGSLEVYELVRAPPNSTRARIACVIYGQSGAAIFDRVSVVLPNEEQTPERESGGGPEARLTVGDDERRLDLRLDGSGHYELTTPGRRALPAVWAALDVSVDPLLLGPRLYPSIVQSGDRGSFDVLCYVPDVATERWVPVEATARAKDSEASIVWRVGSESLVAGESRDRLVVYLESRNEDQPVLLHGGKPGGERREGTFGTADMPDCEEMVVGSGTNRVSLVFSPPVSLTSQPHPALDGSWILSARGEPNAGSIEVTIAFGSRRETLGAVAHLKKARQLHQEGSVAEAIAHLGSLPQLFPDQTQQIEQSQTQLEEWRAQCRRVVEDFQSAVAQFEQNPSPVVYESLDARGEAWSQRFRGRPEGRSMVAIHETLRDFWKASHEQKAIAVNQRLLEEAQAHFQGQRYALCEEYARAILESGADGAGAQEAKQLMKHVEGRREAARSKIIYR